MWKDSVTALLNILSRHLPVVHTANAKFNPNLLNSLGDELCGMLKEKATPFFLYSIYVTLFKESIKCITNSNAIILLTTCTVS